MVYGRHAKEKMQEMEEAEEEEEEDDEEEEKEEGVWGRCLCVCARACMRMCVYR